MFRKIVKLAYEAIKVEGRRWLNPEPMPEPAPVVAAPVQVPTRSKWCSSKYHMEALSSATCLECGAAKKVGAYMCGTCADAARKAVAS